MDKLVKEIIMKTVENPEASYDNSDMSVHTLVCNRHVPFYLYSVKSFLRMSKLKCKIFVYDDGTLTQEDRELLNYAVKGVNIVSFDGQEMLEKIREYPSSLRYFKEHILGKRLLGAYLNSDTKKMIFLDSDVLFFNEPKDVLEWANSTRKYSLFNQNEELSPKHGSVILNEGEFINLGAKKIDKFNAGFVCTYREFIDLKMVEDVLSYIYKSKGEKLKWIWEQTVLAAMLSRFDSRPLPKEYAFSFDDIAHKDVKNLTSKHYSTFARTVFFSEGVKYLIESGKL